MDLGLALIGLGIVTIVVVVMIWIADRRRQRSPPPPAPQDGDQPPTFNVVALGLEGAGKTVLLASQFHKLSVGDRPYFFDADFAQDQMLAWIYRRVGDTSSPWPAGSPIGETREFLFDCKAYSRSGPPRTVFRISYLDYAGDRLEPRNIAQEAGGDLEERVEQAHALLVVIDGQRVRQLRAGHAQGHDYFDGRLVPLLRLAARKSCPVQLIVTKWDLLCSLGGAPAAEEACLREIRECLLGDRHIEHVVHAHGRHQNHVRLIPVSAVGSDFAELREDGTVAKLRDGRLRPVHVEVPLCAVLPDVLQHVERSLDRNPDIRSALDGELARSGAGSASSVVHSVMTSPAGRLVRKFLGGVIGDAAVDAVVRVFVEMLVHRKSRDTAPPPQDNGGEDAIEELRARVIDDMERVVWRFADDLPSSILRRR
jgi:hypothetical protein